MTGTKVAVTRELARFCHAIAFDHLPLPVVQKVKHLALDWCGVALRGALTPSGRMAARVAAQLGPNGGAGIVGTPAMVAPEYAALANGTASHSIELDDVTSESSLHPGVAVFPAVLALAEAHKSPPRAVIAAVVAGYEVIMRLGEAMDTAEGYRLGFHATGTCGVFGAAVAAGKLLGLSAEQMAMAMGIAGSMAAGSMEYLTEGAWTKRLHAGWAAHGGMVAAHLAAAGYTGPGTIIEGPLGYLHAYSRCADVSKVLANLGHGYKVTETNIKVHACCRYLHAPIDAAVKAVRENGIRPEDVVRVRSSVLAGGYHVVADPIAAKRRPQNVVAAQFSFPYAVAVALAEGCAGLDQFTEDKLASPLLLDLMSKVDCYVNAELDRTYPHQWQGEITIDLRDGRSCYAHVVHPKGGPDNPVTWDELLDKFYGLATAAIPRRQAEELVARVHGLEQERDLTAAGALLRLSPAGV